MNLKKDVSIQVIRIISMGSIIACHLVKSNVFAQFLSFGVYTFLFMSGYLYCQKKIDNKWLWLYKQFKKIIIPVYIFILFLSIIYIILGLELDWKCIVVYIFNLQYFLKGISGATHLWFLSVIGICYILTLWKENIKKVFYKKKLLFFVFLIICCTAYFNRIFCNLLFMIFTYFAGMYYKEKQTNIEYNLIYTSIIFIVAVFIKIISHYFIDETPLYNSIIYSIVHMIFAYTLFTSIRFAFSKVEINSNRIINFFDEISYYVFITHYTFILGPLSLLKISKYYFLNVLIILFVSFISAIVLKFLTKSVKSLLK